MLLGGQKVPQIPTIPDENTRKLRASLILEEAFETINAMGFDVVLQDRSPAIDKLVFIDCGKPDLEKTIDGCCDLKVVTTGTLSAFGIPDSPFQEEIDKNNLLKVSGEITRDANGKILKPPHWKPPKIKEILKIIKNNFEGIRGISYE